jgi:release factor glutamine methyltransferase
MPSDRVSLRQAQQSAIERLSPIEHTSAELEASLLLCHLLDRPRSYLYTWPEKTLDPEQLSDYEILIGRRLAGEPIAHITGQREFWSLNLKVTSDTLIPRPETELLVERSLHHLENTPQPLVADLGTGSGAIALALASERGDAEIYACDLSENALAVAQENAEQLALNNVRFHAGDWFQALPIDSKYDLIVSNPPYIEADDPHLRRGDLLKEPLSALISGEDGLVDIRQIIEQAPSHLKPGGWLLFEHGYQQAEAVANLLQCKGFVDIQSHKDLAGHPRVTEGRYPLA